jgi:hypothetical protein
MDFTRYATHQIDIENVVTKQYGATTVHIVPPVVSDDEIANILKEHKRVGWKIIKDLVAKGEMI